MEQVTPYHEGEVFVQEQVGEHEIAMKNARVIGEKIPRGAQRFIARQQYCVFGSQESNGDIWATFLTGAQGVAAASEDLTVLDVFWSDKEDLTVDIPTIGTLQEGDGLGVLFIELATGRRLRVNGRIRTLNNIGLTLEVQQAYPNCPKYIQRREIKVLTELAPNPPRICKGVGMTDEILEWITHADTFFVASAHPDGSMDVSHRGGERGFVQHYAQTLRIPDYPGNSIFNTLGNFTLNPRAGLLFVDFDSGRQLQMTGDVRLEFGQGEVVGDASGCTGRWWEFDVRQWVISPLNNPMK